MADSDGVIDELFMSLFEFFCWSSWEVPTDGRPGAQVEEVPAVEDPKDKKKNKKGKDKDKEKKEKVKVKSARDILHVLL